MNLDNKSPFEEYIGSSEENISKVFSLMNLDNPIYKASDKSKELSIGTAGDLTKRKEEEINPTKAFLENTYDYLIQNYSHNRPIIIPDYTLRILSRTPLVSAALSLRRSQVRTFAKPSNDDNDPGYKIKLRNPDEKPDDKDKKEIEWLTRFYRFCGRTDYEEWQDNRFLLEETLGLYAHESLVMGRIGIEIIETKSGADVAYFRIMDGSTIRMVGNYGFAGPSSAIDPKMKRFTATDIIDQLEKDRKDMIPDKSDIRYIQLVNNQITAAFEWKDLVFYQPEPEVDVWYNGYSPSRLEMAASLVRGFLNSLQYNANAFSRNSIPKIALAMKGGSNFSIEELRRFQQSWRANFTGKNVWNIPILNGDAQVIDLMKAPRDMEYMQYLQMMGGLVATQLGVDIDELGLNFQSSKAVLSENTEGRKAFSKDRGLRDILMSFESVAEKILMRAKRKSHDGRELWEKYRFEFTGLVPKDKEYEEKIDQMKFATHTGFDQLRVENDDKPLWQYATEDLGIDDEKAINALKILGNVPKDSQNSFVQLYTQSAMGGEEPPTGEETTEQPEEDLDSMLDNLFKAKEEIKLPYKRKIKVLNL